MEHNTINNMKKALLIVCLFISVIASGQNNFFWSHNSSGGYGYLYNWYAASDVRNIANTGWRMPVFNDQNLLATYLGGTSVAGGKLKETGFRHWLSPNTDATNESGYFARGGGVRGSSGGFSGIRVGGLFLTTTLVVDNVRNMNLNYSDGSCQLSNVQPKYFGMSIRLIKESTTLTHGQAGTYTGNDGRVYQTICIGTQEWLSSNLIETKYRNGDLIPEVTDNAAWAALTTGARCSYNNTESNK